MKLGISTCMARLMSTACTPHDGKVHFRKYAESLRENYNCEFHVQPLSGHRHQTVTFRFVFFFSCNVDPKCPGGAIDIFRSVHFVAGFRNASDESDRFSDRCESVASRMSAIRRYNKFDQILFAVEQGQQRLDTREQVHFYGVQQLIVEISNQFLDFDIYYHLFIAYNIRLGNTFDGRMCSVCGCSSSIVRATWKRLHRNARACVDFDRREKSKVQWHPNGHA